MHNPRKFDPSIFRPQAEIDALNAQRAQNTFVLWARVYRIGFGHGAITEIRESGLMRFESELDGLITYVKKMFVDKCEQLPPAQEITLSSKQSVGDVVEYHGHRYQVFNANYISPREAADLEENEDVFIESGYYAQARLVEV